jgi:PncC family amidohydrolase
MRPIERPLDETRDAAAHLAAVLRERGWTISTAESCTGGAIAYRITDLPGASTYYIGSIIAYHNRIKEALLDVPAEILARHGAVSIETANRMATACRARFDTDVAISVTGIAGPGGGTAEKPVGLVFVSVATNAGVRSHTLRLSGDRDAVRQQTVAAALRLAAEAVAGERPETRGAPLDRT